MKIYLAGPMRGYPKWNADAFDRLQKQWEEAGHDVWSPIEMDRKRGVNPSELTEDHLDEIGRDRCWLSSVLISDLKAIAHCEGIALLSGWEESQGAKVEVAYGLFLEMKFFFAETMKEVSSKILAFLQVPLDVDTYQARYEAQHGRYIKGN